VHRWRVLHLHAVARQTCVSCCCVHAHLRTLQMLQNV
jgi:hypothetical protein